VDSGRAPLAAKGTGEKSLKSTRVKTALRKILKAALIYIVPLALLMLTSHFISEYLISQAVTIKEFLPDSIYYYSKSGGLIASLSLCSTEIIIKSIITVPAFLILYNIQCNFILKHEDHKKILKIGVVSYIYGCLLQIFDIVKFDDVFDYIPPVYASSGDVLKVVSLPPSAKRVKSFPT